jgi:hypothetical protein
VDRAAAHLDTQPRCIATALTRAMQEHQQRPAAGEAEGSDCYVATTGVIALGLVR